MSQLSIQSGQPADRRRERCTRLDGTPLVFQAPAELAGGDHVVSVNATDAGARTLSAVRSPCTSRRPAAPTATCDDGLKCLGGYCLPGADIAGGLGADCTSNDACITGSCGTDGSTHACTAPCDEGTTCPAGTRVSAPGPTSVCWPSEDDGGGCSTSGGGSSGLALFGSRRARDARAPQAVSCARESTADARARSARR